ncbi:MAG: DNA cytosine methyltransferase [Acidobacteriota bacterium]
MSGPGAPAPRILEFYCGIGGLAATGAGRVVRAFDINAKALEVYRHNFARHRSVCRLIEGLSAERLQALDCDLWWASPPCQPYTRRGLRRDLDDPRAETFKGLVRLMERVRPRFFALENVAGFKGSAAHALLLRALERSGYRSVIERLLCPSQLGLPNRRPRFYLVAGLGALQPLAEDSRRRPARPLRFFLDRDLAAAEWLLEPATARRYRGALHVISPEEADTAEAVTSCFTSAYGRSPVRSGSYLLTEEGPRYFTPREILRLLGFPPTFALPPEINRRSAWRLVGNSLSISPVRRMLSAVRSAPSDAEPLEEGQQV